MLVYAGLTISLIVTKDLTLSWDIDDSVIMHPFWNKRNEYEHLKERRPRGYIGRNIMEVKTHRCVLLDIFWLRNEGGHIDVVWNLVSDDGWFGSLKFKKVLNGWLFLVTFFILVLFLFYHVLASSSLLVPLFFTFSWSFCSWRCVVEQVSVKLEATGCCNFFLSQFLLMIN